MDLYSSDLRLSDIGLDPAERESLAREYPLGMLDEEEEDSCIFNPYSPGSSSVYEDTSSTTDILTDVTMHPQVVDGRSTLMELGDATDAAAADVEGMLDVLNTTSGANLQWIDSFLQSTTTGSPCPADHASIYVDVDEELLVIRKTPRVKNEHSYSLANTPSSASTTSGLSGDLGLIGDNGLKLEDDDGDDELSLEHDDVDVENDNSDLLFGSLVQDESAANIGLLMETTGSGSGRGVTVRCVTSLDDLHDVKPDTDTLLAGQGHRGVVSEEVGLIDEEFIEYVKMEPEENGEMLTNTAANLYKSLRASQTNSTRPDGYSGGAHIMLHLPPTPPPSSGCSSNSSSDSESSLSPTRSPVNSPTQHQAGGQSAAFTTKQLSVRHNQNLWTATIHQPAGLTSSNNSHFTSSTGSTTSQVIQGGMVGTLYLTEEEKRTMLAEGYPLPTKLPLTKQEEKNLKKIRRKIKNKISAQESRRKKKEYLETLEKKVETVSQENNQLKKKVDILETNNRSLVSQLQRLQSLVNKLSPAVAQSTTATTCVLVN